MEELFRKISDEMIECWCAEVSTQENDVDLFG